MLMPMGKFKGQPVEAMTTAYLHWLVCNDAIRFKRWPLVKEALRVLRGRFEDFDALLAGLKVDRPPPRRWDTPERAEQRATEKAEKLRKLEAERVEARRLRKEQRARDRLIAETEFLRARVEASRARKAEALARSQANGQIVDAAEFVRAARRKQDPNDASDLV